MAQGDTCTAVLLLWVFTFLGRTSPPLALWLKGGGGGSFVTLTQWRW